MSRRFERIQMAIVWRLPRWLIRWALIRGWAHATTGKYGDTIAPEILAADVVQRWDSR